MKIKSTLMLLTVAMLLTAFTRPVSASSALVSAVDKSITSTSLSLSSSTTTTIVPISTSTSYSPKLGDIYLKRDKVTLDLKNSSLAMSESYPTKVTVTLKGSLSDPCHQLRVVVKNADAQNQVNMEVYSVFDPTKACITVIQPFTATIPLGSFTAGIYSVNVNGLFFAKFEIKAPTITY
jgi:hypothetical protein